MGCGSLLFTLPHFITDIYLKPNDQISTNLTQSNLCLQGSFFSKSILDKNANLDALKAANKLNQFKYIFIFGQILHGIGAAPLITLGVTLLDEAVPRINSPLYIGIYQTFFVVGPAIGYMIGGAFLELYTDLDSGIIIEDLNPNSPLWVGAWWLGFVMSCLMSWCCALIIGKSVLLTVNSLIESRTLFRIWHSVAGL